MISLNLSFTVLSVLCIWTIGYATDCGEGRTRTSGRCCDMCRPGEHLKEFCSEQNKTVCMPCKEGHFTDKFNMFDRCKECQSCQQEYAEKCTLTTNAKCSCHPGFLCSNNVCTTCEENKCATWEKPKRTDIPSGSIIKYSYRCEPACPNNTYYDVKENNCKAFTQCSAFGFVELFRGNKTHNSVCDTLAKNSGDSLHVILGIGFVLVSLALLVLLCYTCMKSVRKHKASNILKAVETNTSEFPLSKEESGPQLIVQDESKESNSCICEVHLEKFHSLMSSLP